MKTILTIAMLIAYCSLAACTDATTAKMFALGDRAHVICWSGGTLVYDGYSTGKVERAEAGADGYYFKDAKTGDLKEVSGDCNVTYGDNQLPTATVPSAP